MGEHLTITDELVADLETKCAELRAELAASQTRESTLRETLTVASGYIRPRLRYVADRGFEAHGLSIAALMDDPSPASDALGRVARAAVAATKAEWEPDRATLDQARIQQRAAVEGLLAVAPHWGEPQGRG